MVMARAAKNNKVTARVTARLRLGLPKVSKTFQLAKRALEASKNPSFQAKVPLLGIAERP